MAESEQDTFVEALMKHIMEQVKTPKVQVERAVGPILGMFIAEVLSAKLNDHLEMISAEFPLRKELSGAGETNQSTNIDWLLYSPSQQQWVFLELKTTDTTFDSKQYEIYRNVIRRVREFGSSFLVDDVTQIMPASQESGKYKELLSRCNVSHANCTQARLIYLAPSVMREAARKAADSDVEWLSFEDLPAEIPSRFAREWMTIRQHLVQLDSSTRQSRRGEQDAEGRRNFKGTCSFEELVRMCQEGPDAILVGFDGGPRKLEAASLDELQRRSAYKWDDADHGTGVKDGRNWISGRKFLAIVEKLREVHQDSRQH